VKNTNKIFEYIKKSNQKFDKTILGLSREELNIIPVRLFKEIVK
jgi:hypothetical protein